jgi:hypothetical protein
VTRMARWYLALFLIILIPSVSFAKRARSPRGSSEQPEEADSSAVSVQSPAVQSPGRNSGSPASGTSDTTSATPGSVPSSQTQIFMWKDKNHVIHAVNNLSDVPPGYNADAAVGADPKQPVVRFLPAVPQPEAAQPSKKGTGKDRRQSSVSGRHKADHAQERQPDSRERQKLR